MKRRTAIVFAVVLIIAAFIAGGRYESAHTSASAHPAGKRVLYYVDPMNPLHTSDKPGIAPCGMNMEPVYGDDPGPRTAPDAAGSAIPPGAVRISLERQQMIGVRTGTVEMRSETRRIRTVGRVVVDETRLFRLNSSVDGWIKETSNNSTGSFVKKGEVLASFYSPDFLTVEQAYLALGALDRFQSIAKAKPNAQFDLTAVKVKQQVDVLRTFGMTDPQIEELARTRRFIESVQIVSPVSGFILARNISPGLRFEKGTEWFRIADLSRVWVVADLFENEPYRLKAGARATISLPGQDRLFTGTATDVPALFDPVSRALKVRLEVDNPALILRPDMFVDVGFPVALPRAVTVPSEAVLDTGLRKTVFIDKGGGLFEPREVETGWSFGDRVEVTHGLAPGERIVVSGNFLIDSESRMRLATGSEKPAPKMPQAPTKSPSSLMSHVSMSCP